MVKESYLARQPILDIGHRLIAYELLFRQSAMSVAADVQNPLQAGVDVINNTLCIGAEWLLHDCLAFINVDEATLMSEFITLLPPGKVVFEILETVRVSPTLMARVHELRQVGYRFALDDFENCSEFEPLVSHVDYIKLDVLTQQTDRLERLVKDIRSAFRGKLVAEKVEDRAMFDACAAMGFDYFQGYYFARPENIANRSLMPSQTTVLELMNKVRTCDDLNLIEEPLRRDAALTVRLLRLVNSAAFAQSRQIQSVRHALSLIGMKALYRWLTLLLATSGTSETSSILARTAIARGRICELLGAGRVDRNAQDELFVLGVFSLLEALVEVPLATILERTRLPDRLVDALVRREGPYGPYLALAESCETQDFQRIETSIWALGAGMDEVNAIQLQTLAWVEGLDLG